MSKRMTTSDAIAEWISNPAADVQNHTGSVSTGYRQNIRSYACTIAEHIADHEIAVTVDKHTPTTSHHQTALRKALASAGYYPTTQTADPLYSGSQYYKNHEPAQVWRKD